MPSSINVASGRARFVDSSLSQALHAQIDRFKRASPRRNLGASSIR
jgi:hypothetical protein